MTQAQRQAIASGKLAGKTHGEIANQTGLASSTVNHQLRDPRTISIILSMREQSWDDFAQMWQDSVKRIGKAIKNRNETISRNGRDQLLRYMTVD